VHKMDKGKRQTIIDAFIKMFPETKRDQFLYRNDRSCIEWLCPKHGVGHPIWDAQNFYGHGCCGCCGDKIKKFVWGPKKRHI